MDGKGYLGYSLIVRCPPSHWRPTDALFDVVVRVNCRAQDFTTLRIDDQIYPPFRQTANLVELTPDYLNTTGPAYRVSTSRNDIVDTENVCEVFPLLLHL